MRAENPPIYASVFLHTKDNCVYLFMIACKNCSLNSNITVEKNWARRENYYCLRIVRILPLWLKTNIDREERKAYLVYIEIIRLNLIL